MGFYIVDNMPAAMILKFAEFCAGGNGRYDRVALVYDVRTASSFTELFDVLDKLKDMEAQCRMLFLEAAPEVIIKRYKETRRRHPLAADTDSLEEAVKKERAMMAPVKERADFVIDTSRTSTAQLRGELLRLFGQEGEKGGMTVSVTSFGFKYGLPLEADLVFDVRFMPNPFYMEDLRPRTGWTRRWRTMCSTSHRPRTTCAVWRTCWPSPCPCTRRRERPLSPSPWAARGVTTAPWR